MEIHLTRPQQSVDKVWHAQCVQILHPRPNLAPTDIQTYDTILELCVVGGRKCAWKRQKVLLYYVQQLSQVYAHIGTYATHWLWVPHHVRRQFENHLDSLSANSLDFSRWLELNYAFNVHKQLRRPPGDGKLQIALE